MARMDIALEGRILSASLGERLLPFINLIAYVFVHAGDPAVRCYPLGLGMAGFWQWR